MGDEAVLTGVADMPATTAADMFRVRRVDGTALAKKGAGRGLVAGEVDNAAAMAAGTRGRLTRNATCPARGMTAMVAGSKNLAMRVAKGARPAADELRARVKGDLKEGFRIHSEGTADAEQAAEEGTLSGTGDAVKAAAGAPLAANRARGSLNSLAHRGLAKREARDGRWAAKADKSRRRAVGARAASDAFAAKAEAARAGTFAEQWYLRRSRFSGKRAEAWEGRAEAGAARIAGASVRGRLSRAAGRVWGGLDLVTSGRAWLAVGGMLAAVVGILAGVMMLASMLSGVVGAASGQQGAALAAPVAGQTILIPDENGYGTGGFTVTMYGTGGFYVGGRWTIAPNTAQARVHDLWKRGGAKFSDGIAVISSGGRDYYLIACTTTFGAVGDYVFFELDDGTRIEGIVADTKNPADAGCNQWGHNDGKNVIEFEVDPAHFGAHGNPGNAGWHAEWAGKRVVSGTNMGSVFNGDPSTQVVGGTDGANKILKAAQAQIGSVYVWAASDAANKRFDCSGLTSYAYAQAGVAIPHQSEQQKDAAPVRLPVAKARPGDVLWMDGHVAIYAGGDMVIDATPDRGVALRTPAGGVGAVFAYALRWPAVNGND